jgi:ATP-binding cassette subfamily F protein 3
VDKKVKVLSGGERSRLAMARMLLQPFNLLILDEPTNHLDMRSKDILKQALLAFDGTLIVVSHDREFLDGLVDKVFEFRDRKVKEHLGGIYDFLQRKKLKSLRDIERKGKEGNGSTAVKKRRAEKPAPVVTAPFSGSKDVSQTATPSNKEQYREKREQEKKIRKIANRVKSLEHEIEQMEEELSRMDDLLMNPKNIEGMQVYEAYEQLKLRHDEALSSWEKQTVLLEKLSSKRK